MKMFNSIYWYYIYIPGSILMILLMCAWLRISGDLEVCRLYYKEMNLASCYFSSKTVRVQNGR